MNKNILITGATDGIGKATAMNMAKQGHRVIVHGRNKRKTEKTIEEIIHKTGNSRINPLVADFASFKEVENAVEYINNHIERIDILINNAAVILPGYEESKDGYEMTFQVNYLSPFLLTLGILPALRKRSRPQIINIASIAHASSLDFSRIMRRDLYDAYTAYEISKLGNILFTYKLAEELRNEGIKVNCLHPGVINTKLLHVLWSGGAPVNNAVNVINNVINEAEHNNVTGKFFVGNSPSASSEISYDKSVQLQIWDFSLKSLKDKGIKVKF